MKNKKCFYVVVCPFMGVDYYLSVSAHFPLGFLCSDVKEAIKFEEGWQAEVVSKHYRGAHAEKIVIRRTLKIGVGVK